MRRQGWTNKNRPHKKGGFYEIVCPVCKSKNVFVANANDLPCHRHPVVKAMIDSPYYVARKVIENCFGGLADTPPAKLLTGREIVEAAHRGMMSSLSETAQDLANSLSKTK